MKITAITAIGYRNLDGSYGLPAPLAVVVGENNAGKSNLIDALRTVLEPDNPARGRSWLGPDDFAHDGTGAPLTDELELAVRLEHLDGQEQSRMLTCLAPEEGAGVAKLRMKARLGVDDRVRVEWFGGDSEHADVERHAREAIRFVYLHPLRDAAADLRPGRDNKLIPLLAALTPATHDDRDRVVKLVEESNKQLDQVGKIVEARGQVDKRLQGMTGGGRSPRRAPWHSVIPSFCGSSAPCGPRSASSLLWRWTRMGSASTTCFTWRSCWRRSPMEPPRRTPTCG